MAAVLAEQAHKGWGGGVGGRRSTTNASVATPRPRMEDQLPAREPSHAQLNAYLPSPVVHRQAHPLDCETQRDSARVGLANRQPPHHFLRKLVGNG